MMDDNDRHALHEMLQLYGPAMLLDEIGSLARDKRDDCWKKEASPTTLLKMREGWGRMAERWEWISKECHKLAVMFRNAGCPLHEAAEATTRDT